MNHNNMILIIPITFKQDRYMLDQQIIIVQFYVSIEFFVNTLNNFKLHVSSNSCHQKNRYYMTILSDVIDEI